MRERGAGHFRASSLDNLVVRPTFSWRPEGPPGNPQRPRSTSPPHVNRDMY